MSVPVEAQALTSREASGSETARSDPPVGDVFLVVLPALVVSCFLAIRMAGLGDGDSGWHVALGRWIAANRMVPSTDPFSYTALGRPWTAHEWLAGVAMAAADAVRGWPAVVLLYGGALAILLTTIAAYLRRWLPPRVALVPMLACIGGLMPFLLARPHVLAWPVLALWLVALLRARDRGEAPRLPAALLMTLWANLHGSFILGLVLIGPFALEALLAEPRSGWWKVVRDWGLFGLASLVAAMVTPYGPQTLLFPFELTGMEIIGAIGEWKPTDFSTFSLFEGLLLAGLFLCLVRPLAVPWTRLAVVIGLLHMAFAHNRHQAIFMIVTVLVLARPLALAWGGNGGRERPGLREAVAGHRRELMPLFVILALMWAGVAVWRLAVPAPLPDSRNVPASAVARIPDGLRAWRGFGYYSFGGTLIHNRFPVYIDGRADMYGEQIMMDYYRLADGDESGPWLAAQRRWNIGWTVLPPRSRRALWLDKQPSWRRYYADKWAVIHVAQAAWPALAPIGPAAPR